MAVATRSGVCCAPKISDRPIKSPSGFGHIHLELPVASPCTFLLSIAGYRFARTFGPRSGLGVAGAQPRNFGGLLHCCSFLTAACPVLGPPWVLCLGCIWKTYEVAMVLHVVDAISKRLRLLVGCAERWRCSAEKFIASRRSVLVEK